MVFDGAATVFRFLGLAFAWRAIVKVVALRRARSFGAAYLVGMDILAAVDPATVPSRIVDEYGVIGPSES